MSYTTVSACYNDAAFVTRVRACVAQEQSAKGLTPEPDTLLPSMTWAVAGASDVEQAYAYALSVGNENPGGDETVITDAMILAHVQASWPVTPP